MTIFEFLSVAVSIVLALTLGKLISATPYVLSRAVRDVIHSGFFLVTSFAVLTHWWHTWMLSQKETWNFLEFLVVMGSPIALYLATQILVSNVPSEVANWKEHFANSHRWYFGSILVSIVFTMLRAVWVLESDLTFALSLGVLCVAFVIGILSRRAIVHVCVLISWLLFQILAVSARFTAT